MVVLFFFFFSSRRRHTRCLSDWSSDVCSSDLPNVTWVDVKVGDFNGDGMLDIIGRVQQTGQWWVGLDRKSTRLNSSHLGISYAVFCLKKKTRPQPPTRYKSEQGATRRCRAAAS